MTMQEFHAIYEHGILRPLTPINLPEAAQVKVVVHQGADKAETLGDDPLMGFMSDEPDLVDAIVDEAMLARETHPLRANG